MSEEFDAAAKAQSKALGFVPATVQVPHPIQNRTADELKNIAAHSVDEIVQLISGSPA